MQNAIKKNKKWKNLSINPLEMLIPKNLELPYAEF